MTSKVSDPFFDPRSDRTLVYGDHDLETLLAGDAEPIGDEWTATVSVFGFHIMDDGRQITVQLDGYARPVARFEHGTYDNVQSFLADAYTWRCAIDQMDASARRETFVQMTCDVDKGDLDGYLYVPDEPETTTDDEPMVEFDG